MSAGARNTPSTRTGSGLVLAVLASGQFLMTLDSSVMNVSMATVAADLDTTITGIQTAITLYTLVMATLMITGGKEWSLRNDQTTLPRRGRHRGGNPVGAQANRGFRADEGAPRPDWVGPVGAGLGHARVRRAALERMGLDSADTRRHRADGSVGDPVVDPRRVAGRLCVPALGNPPGRHRRRAAARSPTPAEPAAQRQTDDVFRPVHGAGRDLLRGPSSSNSTRCRPDCGCSPCRSHSCSPPLAFPSSGRVPLPAGWSAAVWVR